MGTYSLRNIELSCGHTELWEHTAVGTLNGVVGTQSCGNIEL